MSWRRLKARFPVEVRHKTFHRAVRSLERMGHVREHEEEGGARYLSRTYPARIGGRTRVFPADPHRLLAEMPSLLERGPALAALVRALERESGGEPAALVVT